VKEKHGAQTFFLQVVKIGLFISSRKEYWEHKEE